MKGHISKDPNNHRWTKDTTTFGHRILRSQGWTPGSFLGPEDAPHASLHSAASASYIRVAMKDDAGGLGYRAGGGGDDDIAGMDEVKSIFDRLNGVVESEEVKKEREKRKALVHLGQRIGGITFVRGGLLVQEGLDMVDMREKERVETLQNGEGDKGKRKAEEESEAEIPRKKRRRDDEGREEKRRRKEEKRLRKSKTAESEPSADSIPTEEDGPKPKKPKKSKRDKSAIETPADPEEPKEDKKKKRSKSKSADSPESSADEPPKKSKKSKSETPSEFTPDATRKDKKSKKSKDEKKKEKKAKKERLKRTPTSEADELSDTTPAESDAPTGTSTPTSGPGVRHIHHARKVAAKRAAMTDATALKQILAI